MAEENQIQINPIKFWKQVVLEINSQLEDMTKELGKVQDSFEENPPKDRASAQGSFRDLYESIKMCNAMTAQSEASIGAILSVPGSAEYIKNKLLDSSVIASNANDFIGAINKMEYMV